MRRAKEMIAFKPEKINHPRNIKPHYKEKYSRTRAINVGVSGVINDIIHKQIFTDIPYHRACKRSKCKHVERIFTCIFVG